MFQWIYPAIEDLKVQVNFIGEENDQKRVEQKDLTKKKMAGAISGEYPYGLEEISEKESSDI